MRDSPNFCSRCGGELEFRPADGRERPVCVSCGNIVYINPLPCVAAVIVRHDKILLVKRNIEPGLGEWGLPAGFMEWGEAPEDSLQREILEETGLKCVASKLLTVCSEIIQPYGHVLILAFSAATETGSPVPGDDAADAKFFPLNDHPRLVFKTHREIKRVFLSEEQTS